MMINYSFGLDGTSVSIPVQFELKEVITVNAQIRLGGCCW